MQADTLLMPPSHFPSSSLRQRTKKSHFFSLLPPFVLLLLLLHFLVIFPFEGVKEGSKQLSPPPPPPDTSGKPNPYAEERLFPFCTPRIRLDVGEDFGEGE
jgi:hypothetical protein